MITQALDTGYLDYGTPHTGSSTSDVNQDSYDRYLSKFMANLHGQLNAAAENVSLETDPPPHFAPEAAGIGTGKWIVPLGKFGLVSPVQSRSTLTDYSIREAAAYAQDIVEQLERAFQTRQEYLRRIGQLREYAEEDGTLVNKASERDFWSFIRLGDPDRRAGVMLLDNGNLRAIWKGNNASHVGIQFFGDGRAEYVIFKRRPVTTEVSRVAGIDTLEGIKRQIHAFDLTSLIDA